MQLTNKEGSAESTAKLAVDAAKKVKAPKFSSELKSQKAKEGGDVKFKCKVLFFRRRVSVSVHSENNTSLVLCEQGLSQRLKCAFASQSLVNDVFGLHENKYEFLSSRSKVSRKSSGS